MYALGPYQISMENRKLVAYCSPYCLLWKHSSLEIMRIKKLFAYCSPYSLLWKHSALEVMRIKKLFAYRSPYSLLWKHSAFTSGPRDNENKEAVRLSFPIFSNYGSIQHSAFTSGSRETENN